MLRVLPSQVLLAIDDLFGAARTEIYQGATTGNYRTEVAALLSLLDDLPRELVDLPLRDYTEFLRCRGSLVTALARWGAGDESAVRAVGGKEPIECLRRLLGQCRDDLPPPEPELPFIDDLDLRADIQRQLHAAWANFNIREWMGATTFAGAALEALLLWSLQNVENESSRKKALDKAHLIDLINEAEKKNLISADSASQARLAKDARNLIHAGNAARTGVTCNKATTLSAFAGVYRVVEDFKSLYPG